ncbi:energy-coupled thiamine transporter ThiT [Aquibacillus salsiterrae]|uniref:Energy-coupled thiamine transporter ThiT n=1 Tax=Aquibacillus salsiterrae TaxID=2950439 RepID=A0A9X4AE96_9BACI|nr:energy-coupled thiamine transporter ThiT [Aquibacillus salsiterrae]MDC3416572.1 energy-coupled thiamine transporter ThiT [Aquibacillus salsiterrae]
MNNSRRTLFLIEVAIFSALALVLDLIPFLKFQLWAQGGSVSFAMIPVFIIAYRWGVKGGLLSGFLFGIMQVVVGTAYILTPLQGFIEYGLAFTVLGVAGIFAKQVKDALEAKQSGKFFTYLTLGVFIGSFLRFLAHLYAGVVFFAEYAPEGQPVWLYSTLYNGSYMLPAFVLSTIVIGFLFLKQPRTLLSIKD